MLPQIKMIESSEEMTTSDNELIARCRQGEQEAFLLLVRKYEQRIAATVIGMLGPCAEADDIGQETFIRFFKNLHLFRGQSTPATYLTRIAINLCINEIHRRQRRRWLFPFTIHDEEHKLPVSEETFEDQERMSIIHEAIQKLPPRLRTVLVLRLIDGYSVKETAAMLNLAEGTVLSRQSRSQEKLRTLLKDSGVAV